MLRSVLLVLLMSFSSAAFAQPTLMVLGDSLSAAYGMKRDEGWVSLLAQKLVEAGYPHAVINASISGDTTAGGLNRVESALQRHEPDVLLVELGGNDGLRGIAPGATKANLDAIIERAKSRNIEVVLVGVTLPPNYGAAFNQRFVSLYRELAKDHGLPLAMLSLEQVAGESGMIQDDGLHPTAAAQPSILEVVWPALRPVLETPAR